VIFPNVLGELTDVDAAEVLESDPETVRERVGQFAVLQFDAHTLRLVLVPESNEFRVRSSPFGEMIGVCTTPTCLIVVLVDYAVTVLLAADFEM